MRQSFPGGFAAGIEPCLDADLDMRRLRMESDLAMPARGLEYARRSFGGTMIGMLDARRIFSRTVGAGIAPRDEWRGAGRSCGGPRFPAAR
ncbi:hypothetical protein AO398_26075 [Methylobacterium sp. GXS13]|nr:hypothetical protein AO398_26075 [Methylobacterium sp. GXS13]